MLLQEICEKVAGIVAKFLDCDDYDGKPIDLTPEKVDVELEDPYKPERVWFQGAKVLVEITGFDYPSRMNTLHKQIPKVRNAIESYIKSLDVNYGKLVSVQFIDVKKGSWA